MPLEITLSVVHGTRMSSSPPPLDPTMGVC